MIVVRLMGGLGNQMFQYAAGKRLAIKHNTSVKLDMSWILVHQDPNGPAYREYELDCFALKSSFASRIDLARIIVEPHSLKRRTVRKLKGGLTMFRENETADFSPEVLKAPANTYLEGYWQSEEYFKDVAELIREDFTFNSPPTGKNLDISKLIESVESISLHVRRGDYVSNPNFNKVHGTTSLDYYNQAIDKISKKVKNPHFFIISDDPKWCKENIKIKFPTTYIDHNKKGFEDMRLMSLCNHHIIANSSFSWWGAWLDPKKDKIVVAPKRWFNDPKMSTKNRLPESWIKI